MLVGVLSGVTGLVLGLVAMLAFRISERRRARYMVVDEPLIPSGAADVLAVVGRAYVVVDAVDGVVRANPTAYAYGLVRGHHLVHDLVLDLTRRVREDGVILDRRHELTRGRYGDERWQVHLRIAPLGDEYILILAEDRTELTRTEAIRHDFVANVSHELKTPVGAIGLLSEAIDDAAEDPVAVRRFTRRLSIESVRLGELVQDIIELSRLQSKDVAGEASPVDMNRVVAEAVDRVRTEAEARGITLRVAGEITGVVFGDPDQLMTAIRNLVDNAVSYSPENTVVGIGMKSVKGLARISITDQGPGIAYEDQERVFERFYRVDAARSRQTGGTGLGLSIVKHVVANHGGEVSLWSRLGSGSTFTVKLPESDPEIPQETTESGGKGELR